MSNLDKLLKRIEKNQNSSNEVTTHPLTIANETFDVLTLTRKQRHKFLYTRKLTEDSTFGDVVKWAKPMIYSSLQLAPLAVKAKDAGYISSYYDVVEALFEPAEIAEIITFITKINSFDKADILEVVEDTKK